MNPATDLQDLGETLTSFLPTPQSDAADRPRSLYGLGGGLNAAVPAALYLAWKYERHLPAALTANALVGGGNLRPAGLILLSSV